MGERGNIKVGGVYLYTHWSGDNLKTILQNALKKKLRWSDESYLTRIIFCEMLKNATDESTGYGISTYMCDNNYNIFEVDVNNQTVTEVTEVGNIVNKWSFAEFIKE